MKNTTKVSVKFPEEIIRGNNLKLGVDNIYIGSLENIYNLLNYLNYNLDELLEKNTDVIHQEHLFLIASKKFNNLPKVNMAF